MNDSGEFWRVLGCTCIRRHWKRDIVDTFTHHFCTNGHGWTIGTGFPYIRTSKRQYSTPVQYTCISSCLSWLYFALQALLPLKPYTRWEITCIAALYAVQQMSDSLISSKLEILNALLESSPTCASSHFPNSLQALSLLRSAFTLRGHRSRVVGVSAPASSHLNRESVYLEPTTVICIPLQIQVRLGTIERVNMVWWVKSHCMRIQGSCSGIILGFECYVSLRRGWAKSG